MPVPVATVIVPLLVIDTFPPPDAIATTPYATAVIADKVSSVAVRLPLPQLESTIPSPAAALMTAVLSTTTLPATLVLTAPTPPGA